MIGPKREIGCVILAETAAARPFAGEDAAARHVAPRDAGLFASLPDASGKHGVAKEAGGLVVLAGVHVGLAGVARRVDDEGRFGLREQVGETRNFRVVGFLARQVAERDPQLPKEALERLAHVARATQ